MNKVFLFAGLCCLFTGAAGANCKVAKPGYLLSSHRPTGTLAASLLARGGRKVAGATALNADPDPSGYWYVRFFSDGEFVDDGFDIWGSDGVEVLNDASVPDSGAVCMGVWAKTGSATYELKHPSWIFDDAGVNLAGIVIFRETIHIDPGGATFTGSVVIDAYDLSGNVLDHETGTLTGVRIEATDGGGYPSPIPGLPASILNR